MITVLLLSIQILYDSTLKQGIVLQPTDGTLVMPIILEFQFVDGTSEIVRVPVQIWQRDNESASKVFFFEKEVEKIVLDPLLETADIDRDNNYWPEAQEPSRFELFKGRPRVRGGSGAGNPMQRARQRQQSGGNTNGGN